MSRIEELIKEKCPNGVEYKKLKDICIANFWVMPSTPKYQLEGIPYITSKNIRNGIVSFDDVKYITESDYNNISSNRPIEKDDILISMIGTIGEVGIVKENDLPFYGQNMYLLRLNKEMVDSRYFYHYFTSTKIRNILLGKKNNGNQGYLKTKNIESLMIPIPSITIQKEIVKILDKFGKLEAELEAELEARRCQYEFWRGKLYSKDYDKMVELDTIGDVTKLAGFEFTKYVNYTDKGNIIALRGLNVKNGKLILNDVKFIDTSDFSKLSRSKLYVDDILYTYVGTVGQVGLIDKNDKYYLAPNVARIRIIDKNVIPKYVMYFLLTNEFKRTQLDGLSGTSSMKNITMTNIRKFKIPVPSLEEQKKVVKILDKFDLLTNDISEGLPAEIEFRRKQYEYYRDKILSFKEVEVNE